MKGKFWDNNTLVVITLFTTKIEEKEKVMILLCCHLFRFKQKQKKKKETMVSSSFQVEEQKKCKEGRELNFLLLLSAFGMKHSSCLLLSTFLQHQALHLLQALCLLALWSFVLLKLKRDGVSEKWGEGGRSKVRGGGR